MGNGSTDNDNQEEQTIRDQFVKDKKEVIANQEYEIPPVVRLYPVDTEAEPGEVAVGFDPEYEQQFADELTFELFVYDTYPVGNEVNLQKIAEETTKIGVWDEGLWSEEGEYEPTPDDNFNPKSDENLQNVRDVIKDVMLTYDPEDVPFNQQIRYRVRITNNRTGTQRFVADQSVKYYISYGDYTPLIDGAEQFETYSENESSHILNLGFGSEFPTTIDEEIPYSREAWVAENDPPEGYEFLSDNASKGLQLEIPKDTIEVAEYIEENHPIRSRWPDINRMVPLQDREYYGEDEYNVLDHPIYNQMADSINAAQEEYGSDSHYARLNDARKQIQLLDYNRISPRTLRDGPSIKTPETYWTEREENCAGHSFNLMWLLYHMGYTCAAVEVFDLEKDQVVHLGVGVALPRSVVEEQFPDHHKAMIFDEENDNFPQIERVIDRDLSRRRDIKPESLGNEDMVWMYIEATGLSPIGRRHDARSGIPMGRESISYVIEPEDPFFDVGIENTITKQ